MVVVHQLWSNLWFGLWSRAGAGCAKGVVLWFGWAKEVTGAKVVVEEEGLAIAITGYPQQLADASKETQCLIDTIYTYAKIQAEIDEVKAQQRHC